MTQLDINNTATSGSKKGILLVPLQGFQHKKFFFNLLEQMRKFLVCGTFEWSDDAYQDIQLTIAIMVRHSIVVITLPCVY